MLAAGMTAQVVATRAGMPPIVLLLAFGVLLGPDVLAWLDPDALRDGRSDLVMLGVIVILFEGALSIDLPRLGAQQRPLLLLLTVGAAVSAVGGTLAAHWLVGLPLETAALYGALMIITGPTVVTPLLARLRLDRRLRHLLVSEGVLIDPIGAVAALVVAEWVVGHQELSGAGWAVGARLLTGAAIGCAAGLLLALPLRARWISDTLVAPAVLAAALLVSAGANAVSPEAGLMAAVALGVTLAHAGVENLGRLRGFKERVGVLALSFLFIFLATDLRMSRILDLGWAGLGVVLVLMWVVRPIAVFLSTLGSDLSPRERAFVAWICPRGIVAAAVAGLFRILLDDAGRPGGSALEALVFVTVAVTVAVQGVSAGFVARRLGVDFQTLGETLVIGADALGQVLARVLSAEGRRVALVDRSPWLCAEARAAGFEAIEGDALSPAILEEAGARRADTAVALTRNRALNALVMARVRDNFQIERRLAIKRKEESADSEESPSTLFPGHFVSVDDVNGALRLGRLSTVTHVLPAAFGGPRALGELDYAEGAFVLVIVRGGSAVVATSDLEVGSGDRLVGLSPSAGPLVVGYSKTEVPEATSQAGGNALLG